MNTVQDCLQCFCDAIGEVLFARRDSEWTLHDALRLSERHAAQVENPTRRVNVCTYDSECDLEHQWHDWDVPRLSPRLNALVVLNQQVQGNLRDVIRRRYPASRLILNPLPGFWPGTDSAADLALAQSSLGWGSIEVCRDVRLAVQRAMSMASHEERLVVFWPAPLETVALLPIGSAEEVFRPVM